uniref:Uncharacterized protein n=1 Tax=Rhizophora mucronata TaxID=61149 RepID=A0A2P2P7E8_RHIMU
MSMHQILPKLSRYADMNLKIDTGDRNLVLFQKIKD